MYGKIIHEGNPGDDPYSWVAQHFMRTQQEKPMSAQDYALRWMGQVLAPIYIYLVGMIAAFFFAASHAALGYSPMVCRADAYGYVVCQPVISNPSAKIIHVEPFERESAPPPPPVEHESVPLPRPRPDNTAPIDRPRQVIQE